MEEDNVPGPGSAGEEDPDGGALSVTMDEGEDEEDEEDDDERIFHAFISVPRSEARPWFPQSSSTTLLRRARVGKLSRRKPNREMACMIALSSAAGLGVEAESCRRSRQPAMKRRWCASSPQ